MALHSEQVGERIANLIAQAPAFSGGFVGVHAVQLSTGRVLADIHSDRLFIPASNTKLFSTSLALTRLGPDYRFTTRVLAPALPDHAGVLRGDLILAGGGDPTMSNRRIPYDRDPALADPMEAIGQLADEVARRGVKAVRGDIVGDDSAYLWEPYPPGWAEDDTVWEYGSPVSALTFNHNCVVLGIKGGKQEGDVPTLTPDPALEYYIFHNRLRTVAKGQTKIQVERAPGSRVVVLRGTVPADVEAFPRWLAIDDPALYGATALYEALIRRGITVYGRPVSRHRFPGDPAPSLPGVLLAERKSPPLLEILRVIDKISSNLWAELCLREVARVATGTGSREAGLKELAAFLKETGIGSEEFSFSDASGLSRLTLVKPAAVVRLLSAMYRSPNGPSWRTLLPVGGYDGTLIKRFAGEPDGQKVQAKTGSLTHVNTLSGYAASATFGDIAFSIMVNNTSAPALEVREAIDKIGLVLVQ